MFRTLSTQVMISLMKNVFFISWFWVKSTKIWLSDGGTCFCIARACSYDVTTSEVSRLIAKFSSLLIWLTSSLVKFIFTSRKDEYIGGGGGGVGITHWSSSCPVIGAISLFSSDSFSTVSFPSFSSSSSLAAATSSDVAILIKSDSRSWCFPSQNSFAAFNTICAMLRASSAVFSRKAFISSFIIILIASDSFLFSA